MSLPLIPKPASAAPASGPAAGQSQLLADPTLAAGQYRIESGADQTSVRYGEQARANATATLTQLGELGVGAVTIDDQPTFRWRGVMLDISRHYFGPATIKKVIDVAALYKLNMLHLHLTDDQGWRFEVPSRPDLTSKGAASQVGGGPGGFLTEQDLADLVAYGAERGITIVGEIDLPGHIGAALHAVPGLNPNGEPMAYYTGLDVGHTNLTLDLPETVPFLDDVIGALAAQTPGDFLHVGGDEVRQLEPAQYKAFIEHLEATVIKHGKRPVFWDEAAPWLTDTRSVVQFWRYDGDFGAIVDAANRGHDIVVSLANRAYLDIKYEAGDRLGLDWAGLIPLRTAYEWDPLNVADGIPAERIIGVEAPLWSETIETEDDLFSLLLPRLAAIAEIGWTPAPERDFADFSQRVQAHHALWDARGLAYDKRP